MKTKKIRIKQGFTIVELVIVIGVIGVLTAILVPTFINLTNKANEASNQSFVKNLNTAMAMREQEEGKNKTMSEAVEDAKAIGFDVEKLTPVNGRDLVWDSVANRFALLNQDGTEFYSDGGLKGKDEQIWKIYDSLPQTQTFSIYAKSSWNTDTVTGVKVGFDTGSARVIKAVEYTGTKSVVINSNNDQFVLTIDAAQADVDFYGFAKKIDVKDVKNESLHIYGAVNELAVTKGHVAVESSGVVFDVIQIGGKTTGEGATITNNGYIAETSLSEQEGAAKEAAEAKVPSNVGGDYLIGSREMLETFRNAVNGGNSFADFDGTTKKVKLTADITLADGWVPIGEGNRDVAATNTSATGINTWFAGHFDGQGHKILNLNNKGFMPNEERMTYVKPNSSEKQYAWGLFGLVASGSKFENVTLEGVDFDSTRYTGAVADSVGSLIGYAKGSFTVNNVRASGKLVGTDAISGIVGRVTVADGTINISNCKNSANITSDVAASGIVRLYKWATGYSVTLTNNENTGTIASIGDPNKVYAGGISVFTNKYNGNTAVTINQSGNVNHGHAATISVISTSAADNSKLD